jgi:predicted ester cyclase
MTHMVTSGRHSGDFMGVPATGRSVSLATIRIDRIVDGKIAEHWSVADMAGLVQQLT